MKNITLLFFFLAIFMTFACNLSASIQEQTMLKEDEDKNNEAEAVKDTQETTVKEATTSDSVAKEKIHFWKIHERIFGSKIIPCSKNPKICLAKGSPGPFCCKNKCVNFLVDKENCGLCGIKCKFNEICCKGFCVNALFGKKYAGHCGII
ncbi:stigma-specific STIG1-like protein 1 [Capsicum galapagoense]